MTAEWLAARARNVSGALLVLIALAPLAARGAAQCASIEDPTARLACYDAAYAAPAMTAAKPTPAQSSAHNGSTESRADASTSEGVAAPQNVQSENSDGDVRAAARAPGQVPGAERMRNDAAQAAAPPSVPNGSDRFGLPLATPLAAADEVDQLESTIVAVRKQSRQNTAYRLANGQIWMQTAPREVTIDEGDQVTIRRGMLGGYVLRNRDGASTRVGRIR